MPLVGQPLVDRLGDLHHSEGAGQTRIHGIETFNVLREYFFKPSLSALRWIGNLDESNSTDQRER